MLISSANISESSNVSSSSFKTASKLLDGSALATLAVLYCDKPISRNVASTCSVVSSDSWSLLSSGRDTVGYRNPMLGSKYSPPAASPSNTEFVIH